MRFYLPTALFALLTSTVTAQSLLTIKCNTPAGGLTPAVGLYLLYTDGVGGPSCVSLGGGFGVMTDPVTKMLKLYTLAPPVLQISALRQVVHKVALGITGDTTTLQYTPAPNSAMLIIFNSSQTDLSRTDVITPTGPNTKLVSVIPPDYPVTAADTVTIVYWTTEVK